MEMGWTEQEFLSQRVEFIDEIIKIMKYRNKEAKKAQRRASYGNR